MQYAKDLFGKGIKKTEEILELQEIVESQPIEDPIPRTSVDGENEKRFPEWRVHHENRRYRERPEPPPSPWYRPELSAAWMIPIMFAIFMLVVVGLTDIIFDSYYADLISALVASGIFFSLVAFYYIGRYLDARFSTSYPACNLFWRIIFLPFICTRMNATNIVSSASAPIYEGEYPRTKTQVFD